ncbi:MAG: HAMP domain-containing histidine kinase [Candidatus Dormibacteraeota bacterium]|nr:HAMP domain-containing histidine kinase [Candidatus Dormibacteraeota bacterium]
MSEEREPPQRRTPPWADAQRWRQPPPWWPANERWPPDSGYQWGRRGQRIARRIGCAIGLLLLLIAAGFAALVWLVLSAVGVVGSGGFGRFISAAALLLGLGAFILAAIGVRRLTARAERFVDAAQKIESGDYSARVEVRGPRELRSLARALNAMSSRVEAEETRRRSVLADVAHELRTPLTIIRGQAEGIVDGVYPADAERMAPILAATTRLEAMVDDLRTLALAETGTLRLNREPVDIALLAHETLDGFRTAADEQGVRLVLAVRQSLPSVDGDPVRLGSVLSNLTANALRHTQRGGTVTLEATAIDDRRIRIAVRDDGGGFAPDVLTRAFDRFVRDQSSPGSGLGLAIVRDIVEAHGGTVAARNNVDRGATVEVVLPATGGATA